MTHRPISEQKDQTNHSMERAPIEPTILPNEVQKFTNGISHASYAQEDLSTYEKYSNHQHGVELISMNNCEMLFGNMNSGVSNLMNLSPSFSVEDSLNHSIGESSSIKREPMQQLWIDSSVDSVLSWDGFSALGDDPLSLDGMV